MMLEHQGFTAMRYIMAFLGGIFIFVAVFILSAIVVACLPPVFRTTVHLGLLSTNNLLGYIVACLAATASFRATLRRARAKDAKKADAQPGAM